MAEEEFSPVAALEASPATEVVIWCVMLLAHHARLHLGLIPGKSQKDLEQARFAIDAAGALVDLLQHRIHGDRLSELLMHVADLRLRYVEALKAPPD